MTAEASILIVEDDEVDRTLLTRLFGKWAPKMHYIFAHTGAEALEILLGKNPQKKISHPHIILLDLNLPGYSGLETLNIIRKTRSLYHIPVFILTSSDLNSDKLQAYSKHIAGYFLKDALSNHGQEAIEILHKYCKYNRFLDHPAKDDD